MTQLLPRFHRRSLARLDALAVDEAVGEASTRTEQGTETIKQALTKLGDPRKMRGVPICSMGIGGVSPGTDPVGELMRRSA